MKNVKKIYITIEDYNLAQKVKSELVGSLISKTNKCR